MLQLILKLNQWVKSKENREKCYLPTASLIIITLLFISESITRPSVSQSCELITGRAGQWLIDVVQCWCWMCVALEQRDSRVFHYPLIVMLVGNHFDIKTFKKWAGMFLEINKDPSPFTSVAHTCTLTDIYKELIQRRGMCECNPGCFTAGSTP